MFRRRSAELKNTFAYDIKANLLYGDKTKVVYELPGGDTLEAEIINTTYMGEEWIDLDIRYRSQNDAQIREMVLEWFPDDEDLLHAIIDIKQSAHVA